MSLAGLRTPALLVRLDRVRANLERMRGLLGGDMQRWRPHVKTSKIPQVFDLLLAAGVQRFKCATTREAQVLLGRARVAGIRADLLVAMPHRGPNLARLAELAREFPEHRLALITEDPGHAAAVRAALPDAGLYLDLNPGYDRTGIPRADRARMHATAAACGTALRGLHDYEGHVRHAGPADRAAACALLYAGLLEIAAELASAGHAVRELLTSGTPTFECALACAPLRAFDHQVGPGTVVYFDGISTDFGLQGFAFAATVLASVVSAPAPGRVTCDAGSKALDAAAGEPCARVVGAAFVTPGHPSEEHLPLTGAASELPAPGARIELVPMHVCPTVNLANHAVLLHGDRVLETVPVAARGHEAAF
ncbi:MAG TPA: alanine racemase [Planctomycetota bacterium]